MALLLRALVALPSWTSVNGCGAHVQAKQPSTLKRKYISLGYVLRSLCVDASIDL